MEKVSALVARSMKDTLSNIWGGWKTYAVYLAIKHEKDHAAMKSMAQKVGHDCLLPTTSDHHSLVIACSITSCM
jgi:5-formyltetrahydrofolate cyclo-ligase